MPIRVAIVDDHRLIRDALSDLLSAESEIEVVGSAGDGSDALRTVEAADPDVVLLDLALPDISGLDLIDRIRDRRPATRVLILTMHAEAEYAAAARGRGAHGLVSKSAPLEELIEAIRSVAAGVELPVEGELTEREREILIRIDRGASNEDIAVDLGLQHKTVETYTQQLMAKLDVRTRAGLVGWARRLGL